LSKVQGEEGKTFLLGQDQNQKSRGKGEMRDKKEKGEQQGANPDADMALIHHTKIR
jgi:hypothetical protein